MTHVVQINEHELEVVGNKGKGQKDLSAGTGSYRDEDTLEEFDGYVCTLTSCISYKDDNIRSIQ